MFVIYGAPAAGKTTLTNYLRNQHKLHVSELDEEILKEHNNIWPEPADYRNHQIVPKVLSRIAKQRDGIFVTSGINESFIKTVRQYGGKLVLLKLSKEHLLLRDKKRVIHEGHTDTTEQILLNLSDQDRFRKAIGYDYEIDATLPVEQIAKEILQILL